MLGLHVIVQHIKNKNLIMAAVPKEISSIAERFFGFKIPEIELVIAKKSSVICEELGINESEVPWYAVGAWKDNKIFILDKGLFPERGHDKSEFEKVILHELCHIYIRKMIKNKIPIWVDEGLCQQIAFPDIKLKPKKIVELSKLNNLEDWHKYDHPYLYCSLFFGFLINKYGIGKVVEFLKLLNDYDVEKAFSTVFETALLKCEENFKSSVINEKVT